ncbi:helix-turn-helix transcriptional regulator [Pokkaliibacter sp. CJK22405]|uniref:helix-turn-helix transcriptional regulator n=1 Tax=Pokkaliibacter sp. CJK22405 TaxID=3384615 RepID=UPI003985069F
MTLSINPLPGQVNGVSRLKDVKNDPVHNIPIVIEETLSSSGITLIALWDTLADSRYEVQWPEDRLLPLRKDSVIAVYTRQGHGQIELDDGCLIEPQGHCAIFLKPAQIRRYRCLGMLWDLVWIEMVPNGALEFPFRQMITLAESPELISECERAVELLESVSSRQKSLGVAIVSKLIYEWLTLADDALPATANFKRVERVISALHQNLRHRWSLEEMAGIAQCSPGQLRKLFITYTHTSPKTYVLNAKLDIGKVLLVHKGMAVAEVADKLGFHDSFHFSKAFKARFGVAPSGVKPRGGGVPKMRINDS